MTTSSPYQAYPGSAPEYRDGPPPVLLAVADRARQRRLTVGVRLILLIPHIIVLYVLALAAAVVAFLGWWGALFTGRLPLWAGGFLAGYLRWSARVLAYELLLTDAYPPFTLDDDPAYPVRLALPAPQQLNRGAVFFRVILAIPAGIVSTVLALGAGTLMAFIAWLITLVAGRLPASYHQAFTAVVRYATRYYAYWLMLTPTYPGGLFGDKPGIPTWADRPAALAAGPEATPPFGTTPGYGTAESVYGTAPGGYGAPYSPYAVPMAAQDPAVYGYPAAPGYGAPAGYGARPLFQPVTWSLLLTSAAKKLLIASIVLGAVLWIADIGLQVSTARSASNFLVASEAITTLNGSHGALDSQLTAYQSAVAACDQELTCVTRQDAKAASDFAAFASQLQATPLPSAAASAGARLGADATKVAQAFGALSRTTTVSQYQSAFSSSRITASLADFNADYSALGNELQRYAN